MTKAEADYCSQIAAKDRALRSFLMGHQLTDPPDARTWFAYLTTVKDTLGNISNSVGFVATLLAGEYLERRFGIRGFDAAKKAQGAPGPDIEVRCPEGRLIRCEIKTTKPYQPGFGAQQKIKMKEDLRKLAICTADVKLMLVTDPASFEALCKPHYATHAPGIEIVDLVAERSFRHPQNAQAFEL